MTKDTPNYSVTGQEILKAVTMNLTVLWVEMPSRDSLTFQRNISLLSSGLKSKPNKKPEDTSEKLALVLARGDNLQQAHLHESLKDVF
jgi:hypothetical protein